MPDVIAIIGGTGALGGGLARRCARAGLEVVIGSRDPAKAEQAAASLRADLPDASVRGADNSAAATLGDIVVVTVPFANQAAILDEIGPQLAEKLVVDTTVPLVPPKVSRVQLPPAGSAALAARERLGEEVALVTAFHNVSAEKLGAGGDPGCDILVFGDDKDDRERLIDLITRLGLRGLHGGPLANAVAAEAMTSVLIAINRRYKVPGGAGLRITGLD